MARKRRKKSLYEVIGEGRYKSLPSKSLEQHRVVFTEKEPTVPLPVVKEKPEKWPSRPKMLEIIDGRIEFSLPYTILIAVGLALILVFVVFFRLGQLYEERRAASFGIPDTRNPDAGGSEGSGAINEQQQPPTGRQGAAGSGQGDVDLAAGRNTIVLKQYHVERDLIPAMEFFNSKGIETEIIQRGGIFFLETKKKTYREFDDEGTDGYIAVQRIKDIGAGYEPPEAGYERFKFDDPYGKRAD